MPDIRIQTELRLSRATSPLNRSFATKGYSHLNKREASALCVGRRRRLSPHAEPRGAGRSGVRPHSGADDRAEGSPGCRRARDHVLFVIVPLRERRLRARLSTRELEFLDLNSRVLGWFEKSCPELGFYRISTIYRALVNWDRSPPIHVCLERGGRLPATCAFATAHVGGART